jgi:hypothetical protein
VGAKDALLLEYSPLGKASGGGPLPKDHILIHDLRELHRCVANGIAHHVVLCFDEHRSELLLRHSRNGVGLIGRVLPTPSHTPNDDSLREKLGVMRSSEIRQGGDAGGLLSETTYWLCTS